LLLGAARLGLPSDKHSPAPSSSPASGASGPDDRGAYLVSFGGHPLGTEKFEIQLSGDKIVATAEIRLKYDQGGQTLELDTRPQLVLTPQFQPQTYSVAEKGSHPYRLQVDFRSSPAKSLLRLAASKHDDERDFELAKDVVVLDDNVIHHYQILVDRFRLKPDPKQTFSAYIPQEALPGVLSVQAIGMEELQIAGQKENLQHLVVTTDNAQIDLWVDAQHHLQRVLNSPLQLEAVRTK
jgi:hypothetical protein